MVTCVDIRVLNLRCGEAYNGHIVKQRKEYAKVSAYHIYEHGIVRVKVPVPFPLRWVNGYILHDDEGYVIIDPGLHTESSIQAWGMVWEELQIAPQQINKIILTHHHPDHYGLAGWMQQRTGSEVYMSRTGHGLAQRMWSLHFGEWMTDALCRMFAAHGLPQDKQEKMREHLRSFYPLVSPHPEVRYLEEGEEWQAGSLHFQTISVSGHADQHLVFIDQERKLMFCGDHVLPRITPNISYLPDEDADALHAYLTDLDKLASYDVQIVFPGHRDPFTNLQARAEELRRHHVKRLLKMIDLVQSPANVYDVCLAMFGEGLSIHQLRFAMSETLAHLVYLRRRGYVHMDETGLPYRFIKIRDYRTE